MIVDPVVLNITQTLRQLIAAVNGQLALGDNLQASLVTVADTGSANTEFTVNHNLGRVPTRYVWNISAAGVVYDSNRPSWTSSQITLKCSIPNATLYLIIL